jgi:hypothetical protein
MGSNPEIWKKAVEILRNPSEEDRKMWQEVHQMFRETGGKYLIADLPLDDSPDLVNLPQG